MYRCGLKPFSDMSEYLLKPCPKKEIIYFIYLQVREQERMLAKKKRGK